MNPSSTNGKPYTSPKGRISPGQRMPISNDSSVPDTAPAANSTPITFDQVRARSRRIGLPRRCAHSGEHHDHREHHPEAREHDVPAQRQCHLHPRREQVLRRTGQHEIVVHAHLRRLRGSRMAADAAVRASRTTEARWRSAAHIPPAVRACARRASAIA